MTDRVDYTLTDEFDIEQTEWNDFRIARDETVLEQNLLFTVAEETSPLVGEQLTATDLSRARRKIEERVTNESGVSYVRITRFDIGNDGRVEISALIGSEEFDSTIYV